MPQIINIYCDESCHLEHDRQPVMAFGAITCPLDHLPAINTALTALKAKHNARGELKWEKVSPSRLPFYLDLIDWFFSEQNLRFRGWIVRHKERLAHDYFNAGSHDSFYYKMFYYLLEPIIGWPQPGEPERTYRVYLDIKDTRSRLKIRFLGKVLRGRKRDLEARLISRLQSARSDEVQTMQLVDFLLGALTYRQRAGVAPSQAKLTCVQRIEQRTRFPLSNSSTPPWEEKFNFFTFTPQEVVK